MRWFHALISRWGEKIVNEIRRDRFADGVKALELCIETMERMRGSNWSTAHDDDLRTLKRALHILKKRSQ